MIFSFLSCTCIPPTFFCTIEANWNVFVSLNAVKNSSPSCCLSVLKVTKPWIARRFSERESSERVNLRLFMLPFSVFMKSLEQLPRLFTKKESSICIVLPSAGHHNAAQTLTVRSSVCSDEDDLAAKQDSVRSVWMWKQQSSLCQMMVSQRSLEAQHTREELLTISESCLMSWLEHVMILLVDCCRKCLQRNVGQMDCWTALKDSN